MPVFELTKDCLFPDPNLSEPDGLLAYGGDLSVKRLLVAYSEGIFPWFSDEDPILWWSPDPRMVLFTQAFIRHKSLRSLINKGKFQVTFDTVFDKVIRKCAEVERLGLPNGTWITEEMVRAYKRLHRAGYAHSVETWFEGELVGGLYGISLGGMFFGESMFHTETDASKIAIITLMHLLNKHAVHWLDTQMVTSVIGDLGGIEISRDDFINNLNQFKNIKEALNLNKIQPIHVETFILS